MLYVETFFDPSDSRGDHAFPFRVLLRRLPSIVTALSVLEVAMPHAVAAHIQPPTRWASASYDPFPIFSLMTILLIALVGYLISP